jgi:hypothetical protein
MIANVSQNVVAKEERIGDMLLSRHRKAFITGVEKPRMVLETGTAMFSYYTSNTETVYCRSGVVKLI